MPINPNAVRLFEFIDTYKISLNAIARTASISHGTLRAFRDIKGRYLNQRTRIAISKALNKLTNNDIDIFYMFGCEEDTNLQWYINNIINENLATLLLEKGISPTKLAAACEIEESEVFSVLRGDNFSDNTHNIIASYLHVNADQLGREPKWKIPQPILDKYHKGDGTLPRDLPIRPTTDETGTTLIALDAIGYTVRPPTLLGNPDAYALYMPNETMRPRLSRGEMIYVDPHWPITIGDDVIVYLKSEREKDSSIYVAHLTIDKNDHYIFATYTPPDIQVVVKDDVILHKILRSQDLILR